MASIDNSGNITCTNNTTFYLYTIYRNSKTGIPYDLTGFTAKMQVKTGNCEEGCSEPTTELSTENGRIVLGGIGGTVIFNIAEEDMAVLPCGQYFYDCIINTGSTKIDYFKGVKSFIIQGGITRE